MPGLQSLAILTKGHQSTKMRFMFRDSNLLCSLFLIGLIDLPGHRCHMVESYISHRPTARVKEGPDMSRLKICYPGWPVESIVSTINRF